MTRVLFVADQFSDATRSRAERHPGGAELTDEAAIAACPWPLLTTTFQMLASKGVGPLEQSDIIVVGNSETASPEQLLAIARSGRHVTFEHDLRICRWRGNFPSGRDYAHRMLQRCWCAQLAQRELFERARGAIFLTHLQESYYRKNPFFGCPATRVLGSSLFGPALLEAAASTPDRGVRSGASVFASPHPVKGYRQAIRYCRQHGLVPREIRGLSPPQVLEHFAASRSFVYLPIGPEWAGRMLVEARLLGCQVVTNELAGVASERFWQGDREGAVSFLADGPHRFWRLVEELMSTPRHDAVRPVLPLETVAEKLSGLLRAPRVCFWPVGPGPLRSSPVHSYAAW